MVLSQKVLSMNKIIRLAVDEQAHLEEQADIITRQLEEENKMLRSLLKISKDFSAPTTQNELLAKCQEYEKHNSELSFKAEQRLREQLKNEVDREYETMKQELPKTIEKELAVKFDVQTKELESMYEEKLKAHEEETALLKKTLLEQSLQRLTQI